MLLMSAEGVDFVETSHIEDGSVTILFHCTVDPPGPWRLLRFPYEVDSDPPDNDEEDFPDAVEVDPNHYTLELCKGGLRFKIQVAEEQVLRLTAGGTCFFELDIPVGLFLTLRDLFY